MVVSMAAHWAGWSADTTDDLMAAQLAARSVDYLVVNSAAYLVDMKVVQ